MRYVLSTCLFLILLGCGADAERKREDAILSGQILLDTLRCQEAIEVLEEVGRDSKNIVYTKTLASAYACRAGYNTPSFFTDDIPKIASSGNIIGGFTNFTNASTNDAPDNDSFEDMQTAIDLLLYAGGFDTAKDPTIQRRATAMKSDEAEEVNAYLLFLILDQLGRYFYHYGDADSSGVKGGRDDGKNECLANYNSGTYDTDAVVNFGAGDILPGTKMSDVLAKIHGLGISGECGNGADDDGDAVADEGHPDFGSATNLREARLCQGVILWNNFRKILVEVLANVTSDDFGELDNISAALDTQVGYLETALPLSSTYVTNTLSQTKCVADNNALGTTEYLEWYFVFIFEALFGS
jgi:hypothetical protein